MSVVRSTSCIEMLINAGSIVNKTTITIDDDAKDGGKEPLPRCTAFFNRIPIEGFVIQTQSILVKSSSPPSLAQLSVGKIGSMDDFIRK